MAFKPMKTQRVYEDNRQFWPSNPTLLNGGLNLVDKEWKIADNQTSKVKNMWFYNGELSKRWGQELLDDDVESPCYSTYKYLFQGYIIKHCGTKLYRQDPSTGATTEIYTGLTAQKGSFFKFNSKLYYINGAQYVQYDGGEYGNLLGTDGNCDIVSKFDATQVTPTLESTNKVDGMYGFKLALTSSSGSIKKLLSSINVDISKYYMMSAYLKNGNATNCSITKDATGGGSLVTSSVITSTSPFTRVCIKVQPSDLNAGNYFTVNVTGTSGQYVYFDSIMINEISSTDYAMTESDLMTKYPHSDLMGVIQVVPYVPTVIINRTPTGGGNANDQYNRIGKGFRNSFNGTGSATTFTLTDTNLDATLVTATVGGVAKLETTDFTVNRTTGIVTFSAVPALGTNNVVITAYKTDQDAIDSILKCKYAMPFGGQNDNRIFIGGNNTGYFYYTGISAVGVDASYWPYNYYNIIGNPDDDVTGFAKSYDVLTIHKKTGEIYGETYEWNGTNGIFNTFPIAQKGGCDCPFTLDVVNNHPVWLNSKYGAGILVGTSVGNQRNVFHISRNIDPWLLNESNLADAVSVDFNGHYCLCVNNKVYPWNYFITPYVDTGNPEESAKRLSWWYWDNINAGSFVTDGLDLYYGERDTGKVVKFHRELDANQFVDFDTGISALYRLPLRDLGGGVYEFDVLEMWVDCRGDTQSAIDVMYITSDDINGDPATDRIELGTFSLDWFSLDAFTLQVIGYKETFALSPMEKKIDLFGVEFSNSESGRDMNIGDVKYSYRLGKEK